MDFSWLAIAGPQPSSLSALGWGLLAALLVTGACIYLHRNLRSDLENPWPPLGALLLLLLILFVAPLWFAVGVGLYSGYLLAVRAKARAWQREEHAPIEARARELMLRDPNATVSFERLADVLEAQGRHEELLDTLGRWQARDPENPEVRHRLERVRLCMPLS